MFIQITNEDGDKIYLNTDNVTIIKPFKGATKFYVTDGGYGICLESPSTLMEIMGYPVTSD